MLVYTLLVYNILSTPATKPKIKEILRNVRSDFHECVDAEAISSDLVNSGIIPDKVKGKIEKADDMRTANGHLYEHLSRQGTESSVMKAIDIMSETEGYPRMNEFGKKWREKIEGLFVCLFVCLFFF